MHLSYSFQHTILVQTLGKLSSKTEVHNLIPNLLSLEYFHIGKDPEESRKPNYSGVNCLS